MPAPRSAPGLAIEKLGSFQLHPYCCHFSLPSKLFSNISWVILLMCQQWWGALHVPMPGPCSWELHLCCCCISQPLAPWLRHGCSFQPVKSCAGVSIYKTASALVLLLPLLQLQPGHNFQPVGNFAGAGQLLAVCMPPEVQFADTGSPFSSP